MCFILYTRMGCNEHVACPGPGHLKNVTNMQWFKIARWHTRIRVYAQNTHEIYFQKIVYLSTLHVGYKAFYTIWPIWKVQIYWHDIIDTFFYHLQRYNLWSLPKKRSYLINKSIPRIFTFVVQTKNTILSKNKFALLNIFINIIKCFSNFYLLCFCIFLIFVCRKLVMINILADFCISFSI